MGQGRPVNIMRAVEAALTDEPQTMFGLAVTVYGRHPAEGSEPTRAQVESIRRAVHRLQAMRRADVRTLRCVTTMVRNGRMRGVRRRFLTASRARSERELEGRKSASGPTAS
jgi:hypothetical protein